jgi:hypothetical protein
MVRPRAEFASLRFSRLEKGRLLIALALSLFAHAAVWGGYEAGEKTGLWNRLHWPVRHLARPLPRPVAEKTEPPIFLEVSEASAEPPKQAKYYSDRNSRAANPDADLNSNQPKLAGTQKFVPKTEDTPKPVRAKPTPPATPQKPTEAKPAQNNPAKTLMPGALDKGRPDDTAKPDEQPTPERPRTIRQALAQQPNQIAGQQMQQAGGVKHRALKSSLDAISTPFGAYDRAIIEAVQQRWYDLLDSQKFASDRTGKVTVYFHLNPDGSVTESKVTDNNVGALLGYVCQEAIEQSAPFGKWPADMRRMVGADFREITFTFYYY